MSALLSILITSNRDVDHNLADILKIKSKMVILIFLALIIYNCTIINAKDVIDKNDVIVKDLKLFVEGFDNYKKISLTY